MLRFKNPNTMKGDLPRPGSTERHIGPGSEWENSSTFITTGTSDSFEAAWYLTKSKIWPLVCHPIFGPFALGLVLFLLIGAMVVLSPAAQSHFIYTDF